MVRSMRESLAIETVIYRDTDRATLDADYGNMRVVLAAKTVLVDFQQRAEEIYLVNCPS